MVRPTSNPVHGQLDSNDGRGRIPAVLGAWGRGREPLYRQLAVALRAGIGSGAIVGQLSPERELARELGVSRSTVVAAYDLLADEGVIVRRPRSGTSVGRPPGPAVTCEDPLACVLSFFGEARGDR